MALTRPQIILALLCSFPLVVGRTFILPHSHLDMGWLNTIDGYYGTVERIFDSVMDALKQSLADPKVTIKRKYNVNDIGYFRKWIEADPSKKKDKLKTVNQLIEAGVLEIVGTSLVMADTACPHYEDFVSNFFEGIAYTERHFQTRSQTVWQLDSFGQSTGLFYIARLFGIYDAVFPRIHQHLGERMAEFDVPEFSWKFTDELSINVHLIPKYSWDVSMDHGYYTLANAAFLKNFFKQRSKGYYKDSLVLLGDDFTYQDALKQFRYFEETLAKEKWPGYSTMNEYLDAFYAKKKKLPVVAGDFLPYMDIEVGPDAWTGYFTSKPHLKYKIRRLNKLQRALTVWVSVKFQMLVSNDDFQESIRQLISLNQQVPLFLHHDAITGTAKREVDADYLDKIDQIERKYTKIYSKLVENDSYICDFQSLFLGLTSCFFLNEALKTSPPLEGHVLNPSGHLTRRRLQLAIPKFAVRNYVLVYTEFEVTTPCQAICFDDKDHCLIYFELEVPPANGSRKFWLKSKDEADLYQNHRAETSFGDQEQFSFENTTISIGDTSKYQRIDQPQNRIKVPGEGSMIKASVYVTAKSITLGLIQEEAMNFEIQLMVRPATISNTYVTRFNLFSVFEPYGENLSFETYASALDEWGVIVYNTKATFWIYQPKNQQFFEVKMLYGWDKTVNFGFEVAFKISRKDFPTEAEFWTESNGLFELRRKNVGVDDYNIYPTTTKASLRHPKSGRGMSVWVDRSRGVFADGNQLMFIIQRSGSNGKGNNEDLRFYEETFNHFYVHNYFDKNEAEIELVLRNLVDVDTPVFISKHKQEYYFADTDYQIWSLRQQADLGESIRLTVSMASEDRLVVRIQNIHRTKEAQFDANRFFEVYYNFLEVKEVPFHFVTNPTTASATPPRAKYTLKPLEFRTFSVAWIGGT